MNTIKTSFISMRDLQTQGSRLRADLAANKHVVLTNNGVPFGIAIRVTEENLVEVSTQLTKIQALSSLATLRDQVKDTNAWLSDEQIKQEIHAVRKSKKMMTSSHVSNHNSLK